MKFSKILINGCVFTILFFSSCTPLTQEVQVADENALPRSTPESQWVSSEGLITFLDSVKVSTTQFHGVMVLRHGQVIAEGWWNPYKPAYKHQLYSLSKSFTSTAVGFAIQEGLMNLEDTVYKFFPEFVPEEKSENLSKLKVKHLLTMSTGQIGEPMEMIGASLDESWVKTFLSYPIENKPGTIFSYNTAATFMLSAILQEITGKTVEQFLTPRFFKPLGILETEWLMNPDSINTGGFGFRTTLESVAKLGQFYLQKGMWDGEQLLNRPWIENATSKQIETSADGSDTSDWGMGYGFQFWRNTVGGYRADGAFGQFCIVLPKYDAVIAINSQSADMGVTMKLVWDYIIPTFRDEQLIEKTEKNEVLLKRLTRLNQKQLKLNIVSPRTSEISGKTVVFEPNELGLKSMSFKFYQNLLELTISGEGKEDVTIIHGMNGWVVKENFMDRNNNIIPTPVLLQLSSQVAAFGTWVDTNMLQLTWQFIETVHGDQVTLTFDDEKGVEVSFLNSVAAAKNELDARESIRGKLQVD
ncbi:MAG: serine hydrolase [Reichenbachiella sp.]